MAIIFNSGAMRSDSVFSMNRSVYYVDAQNNGVACPNGAFLTITGIKQFDTYGAAKNALSNDIVKAPAAVTDSVVVADLCMFSSGTIAGEVYRLGEKQYDLAMPAGEPVRVRELELGDRFWLGDGNFEGTPEEGKYAVLTAGKVTLTPADNNDAEGFTVQIIRIDSLTTGQRANGSKILCEVIAL